jgi:CDP-glucose 4,6-dehydratase
MRAEVRAGVSGFWEGRRVLVTGHTGFKGAWLALWLHRLGAEVTGFSAAPPTTPSLLEAARIGELVDDVRGDVRARDAVGSVLGHSRPEVVFHQAA